MKNGSPLCCFFAAERALPFARCASRTACVPHAGPEKAVKREKFEDDIRGEAGI